jgi:hypothetical protein
MKQYTTPEQTAKLIELGFEKPKNRLVKQRFDRSTSSWIVVGEEGDYSIGELIEMLPKEMDCELGDLGLSIENNIYEQPNEWIVSYDGRHQTNSIELVDALYDMVVKLKEEGVI